MTTTSEPLLRNFQWSDIDELSKLLNEVRPHGHRDWPTVPHDLRIELEFPRVQPENNMAIAFEQGDVAGYAIVEPEQNIGRSVIGVGSSASGSRTVEALIEWAVARAGELAPIIHIATRDTEIDLADLVRRNNWEQVRKYLKLEINGDLALANAAIPTGFSTRTMLGLEELSALTHLQNASFKEHFGYSPNTEDEIKLRLIAPRASFSDVVMIHDFADRLVAYCWTATYGRGGSKIGRIGMTGVLPDARGQGLGRAIAESGYNHLLEKKVDLIELDVDSSNAPALKIYSSLGFNTSSSLVWWEKTLERV